MSAFKRKILPIIGISCMVFAAILFSWYEWLGGRELINYQDVYVLKDDIQRGVIITEEMLTTAKIEKSELVKGAIEVNKTISPSELPIIGLASQHFIPKNAQLHPLYFEDTKLVLKENQYVAKIPIEWTLSVPDSLRRGDQIIIYSALYEKELLKSLQVPVQTQKANETPENTPNESPQTPNTNEFVRNIDENTQLNKILNTTVAYVKDGANREVTTLSKQDRLDGSSIIRSVEIITTTEEFEKIENQIKQGARLIIMYTDKENLTLKKGENEDEKTIINQQG